MSLPETWVQIAVVVAAVVPGFVYQISRRAAAGPSQDQTDIGVRVLRAIATSVLFAGAYLIALGPQIIKAATDQDYLVTNIRLVSASTLLLAVLLPWAIARLWHRNPPFNRVRWVRRALVSLGLAQAVPAFPSAWDYAFALRRARPAWVRIQHKDGTWTGGIFGDRSYASASPDAQDLFLERTYLMDPDGAFTADVAAEHGSFIRCADIARLDFFADVAETEASEPIPEEGT